MRNYLKFSLLFVSLFTLISCNQKKEVEKQNAIFDYSDFGNNILSWEKMFSPANPNYFVYFYSPTCGHCSLIKEKILNYTNEHLENFYLSPIDENTVVSSNIKNTIGATSYEEMSILGTPSLIEILNKKVVCNIAGTNDILLFLNLT